MNLPEFNPSSTHHNSIILFGGSLKVESIEISVDENGEAEIYKSGKKKGQIKTRKVKIDKEVKGFNMIPQEEWKTKRDGINKTDEGVLQIFAQQERNLDLRKYAKTMLKIRELEKQISTYYSGAIECVYPDNCIRASFSHSATATGRLACSKPNIANIPTDYSLIKQHFTSRFKEGFIISADYSQLEIRVQAQLSGDTVYIQDVLSGTDFHLKRLSFKLHEDYEEVKAKYDAGDLEIKSGRSAAKAFSFARTYGAGVKKLSQSTGLHEEEIKQMIETENETYPELFKFNEFGRHIVERQGFYKDPWGRRYKFKKYPALSWQKAKGINMAYSPTEMLNYRVQGFATGNIVLCMLGIFWRQKAIYNRDKYLLINTVHDSVMLDCKKEFVEGAKKDLKVLEECSKLSLEVFNYKFVLPIPIDIKSGNSWLGT